MICTISGNPTSEPVLSLKSKKIFDRKLLLEYISQNGTDPVTGDPMTEDDLVSIDDSINIKSITTKKSNQDSIPSMLSMFQNEWDALALELFTLRKQVSDLKKELSLSLYRQDAAIKVAASAIEEKNQAKKALQELAVKIGSGSEDLEEKEEELVDDSEAYLDSLKEQQQQLFAFHKSHKQKLPFNIGSSAKLVLDEGSTAIEVNQSIRHAVLSKSGLLAILYENSGTVYSMDKKALQDPVQFKFRGKILDEGLGWINSKLIMVTKTRVMSINPDDGQCSEILKAATKVGAIMHPTLNILILLSSHDYRILFNDRLVYTSDPIKGSPIVAGAIHNDGVLMALGQANGQVQICDIVQRKALLKIPPPNGISKPVTELLFPLNGYWLVIRYGLSTVFIYDLRKAAFQSTLEFPDAKSEWHLSMDPSSKILFLGGSYMMYMKKEKIWTKPESVDSKEPILKVIVSRDIDGCYCVSFVKKSEVITGKLTVK